MFLELNVTSEFRRGKAEDLLAFASGNWVKPWG